MRAVDILRFNKKGADIWGVDIDYTNSNPLTSVTYTDKAVGMTAGSSDWDSTPLFANIRPCLLKNGSVNYYLNPSNFAKKEDGVTNADITSGNDGDVMIEIPKLGYKITTSGDGNTLSVRITTNPNLTSEGFCYYAHTRTTEGDRDYLYIGAYKGYKDASNKWRSLSGKTPSDKISLSYYRTYARNNGNDYDIFSFYPLTLLQCLYLIKYKNLDSQAALGQGYTKSTNVGYATTGGTNTKGMCWGGTDTQQMKLFGIEDLWGNLADYIDGVIFLKDNGHCKTAFEDFNNTGNDYPNEIEFDFPGYFDTNTTETTSIKKIWGTNIGGFIPKEYNGEVTDGVYFPDNVYWAGSINRPVVHGGANTFGPRCGIFCWRVRLAFTLKNPKYGARLMYL